MTKAELKQVILDCCDDVLFTYNGEASGITSDVKDYVPTFHAWHGEAVKDYSDVDELLSDPFFGGRSLNDLIDKIEFTLA